MTPEQTGQMQAAAEAIREILRDSLVAVYLHGSAVAAGLRPHSDLDLIAVVDRGPTDAERDRLLAALLRLSVRHPEPEGRRCLEVMVYALPELHGAALPARSEFTYGEWLRAGFEAGGRPGPDPNPDHALVIAQARQGAVALFGPDAASILPEIAPDGLRAAMAHALPALMANLRGDERNVLLTLARMWFTAATGNFAAKDAAAAWAIPRLAAEEAATLDLARRAYLGAAADDWSGRRAEAQRLADHLRDRIAGMP